MFVKCEETAHSTPVVVEVKARVLDLVNELVLLLLALRQLGQDLCISQRICIMYRRHSKFPSKGFCGK
jgi:hypothetical protein